MFKVTTRAPIADFSVINYAFANIPPRGFTTDFSELVTNPTFLAKDLTTDLDVTSNAFANISVSSFTMNFD